MTPLVRRHRPLSRFLRDRRGTYAVEFAVVAAPLLFTVLWVLQMSLYYVTQTSLDIGVNNAADYLRSSFAQALPTYPDAATLKAKIASTSGGFVHNDATLAVDIRPLTKLNTGTVAITDESTPDYGAAGAPLVLRAQANTFSFAPGFKSTVQVQSSAIVRRKSN